jgi:uncharacterized protein YndB with AHSA1/START domain
MIPTTQPDGTLETRGGRHVIRFERRLSHPVEQVWSALTEPDELIGWLAQAKLDLVEGGDVELRWQNTNNEGEQTVLHGTITELDPPRVIEYDSDIHGLLRWELREEGSGCHLTFTATVALPEDYKTEVLAGWHIHLDHLADALDGKAVNWPTWAEDHMGRWKEYQGRYAAAVSP